MSTTVSDLPAAKSVLENPSAEELRALTERMPNARVTAADNVNVETKVVSRSTPSTFIVSEEPVGTHQTIARAEYDTQAARQDAYIAERDMVLVEGWIGDDEDTRVPVCLYIEQAFANIAGMQRLLYFSPGEGVSEEHDVLTVIYTPGLNAPGYPSDRLVGVDLEARVTRVIGSDYFGESKKGNLRQWNRLVYERGGLSLHAGAKIIPTDDGQRSVLIVGLSGTGKTTTTFTRQNGSLPVQDDFVAWWPNGRVSATEAGCFAKTFALSLEDEPTIYNAVMRPDAYLENVSQHEDGTVDFFDTSYTKNGRSVFSFSSIEHAPARELGTADVLLILNRNENVIPAVAKLSPEQAAAYFMLGESTGTSAGGAAEEGKFLRVPGTNGFFPMPHGLQGNRFLELMRAQPLEVYLLNTGSVGGKDGAEGAKKVKIRHSSAIVKGIAEGTIAWTRDPDFGYETATSVPGIDAEDADVLNPAGLYERQGRAAEYREWIKRMKRERVEFLHSFPELDAEIRDAVL